MRTLAAGAVALAMAFTVAAGQDKKGDDKKEKKVYKVTADEIAKEFKDDPMAAKRKYEGAEIRLTGKATLAIGSGKDTEVLVENDSKIPIRLGTAKRPANFPAKFEATATYKGYFEMAKELSLTASKMEYK
jgi:hypothetical protein